MTLRNLDDGLEENLRSIFLIDYPNYDVFFAVDGMEDPCIATIERVRSRFHEIPSAIVPAGYSQTHNPKVVKLARLERLSDAKLFWLLIPTYACPANPSRVAKRIPRSRCENGF